MIADRPFTVTWVDPPAWISELVGAHATVADMSLARGALRLALTLRPAQPRAVVELRLTEAAFSHEAAGPTVAAASQVVRRAGRRQLAAHPGFGALYRDHPRAVDTFVRRSLWLFEVLERGGAPTDETVSVRDRRYLALLECLTRDVSQPTPQVSDDVFAQSILGFLDATQGRWDRLFVESGEREPWLVTVLQAVDGNVAALRTAAAVGLSGPPASTSALVGMVLAESGFSSAAVAALSHAAPAVSADSRSSLLLDLGELHRNVGNMEDAVTCIRHASLLAATDVDHQCRCAEAFISAGNLDDAHRVLLKCLDHDASHAKALELATSLALWSGRLEEADSRLQRLGQMASRDGDVAHLRGVVAMLRGDHPAAVECFREALSLQAEIRPGGLCEGTGFWLVEALLRMGRDEEALREMDRFGTSGTVHVVLSAIVYYGYELTLLAFLELLESLGEAPPEGGRAASREAVRARCFEVLDSFGGNRTRLLTRRAPPEGRLLPIEMAPGRAGELEHMDRHQSEEAVKQLRTEPPAKVVAELKRLAEVYPASPHPLCYRGEVHLWLGEYAEALACFDAAFERRDSIWIHVGRGAACLLLGDLEGAAQGLEVARTGFPPMSKATVHVYEGELHRLRGDLDAARVCLERSVATKPGRIGAWINLALVHDAQGDDGAASEIREDLRARVPRLLWDAGACERGWPEDRPAWRELLEAALGLMRGNRSSHLVTYFDGAGGFRIVGDARRWSARLQSQRHHLAAEVLNRMAHA